MKKLKKIHQSFSSYIGISHSYTPTIIHDLKDINLKNPFEKVNEKESQIYDFRNKGKKLFRLIIFINGISYPKVSDIEIFQTKLRIELPNQSEIFELKDFDKVNYNEKCIFPIRSLRSLHILAKEEEDLTKYLRTEGKIGIKFYIDDEKEKIIRSEEIDLEKLANFKASFFHESLSFAIGNYNGKIHV